MPAAGRHSYVLGLTLNPANDRLIMITTQENWEAPLFPAGSSTFLKAFLPSGTAPINLFLQSRAIYHSGFDTYVFTGGLFDSRLYHYRRSPPAMLQVTSIPEMITPGAEVPTGTAFRNPTGTTGSALGMFLATPGWTDPITSTTGPALVYIPDFTQPYSSATSVVFGTSGAGQISAGIGALALGPDGFLNALDTGTNRILRYDPSTLEFVSAITLANTTTSNLDFAISSTGLVFTHDTAGGHGYLYNYYTSAYLGTYTSTNGIVDADDYGPKGKLSMVADSSGRVYIYDPQTGVQVYDTSTFAAIPEPSTYAAFAGAVALGFAARRRRRPR